MPKFILAGTRAVRRPDPAVSNLASPEGLYPWSAFIAYCGEFSSGEIISSEAFSGDILLFLTDFPAKLYSVVNQSSGITLYSCQNLLSTIILVTDLGGSTSVVLPAYGKVATGYTGLNNDVLCQGFPIAPVFPSTPGGAIFGVDVTANGAIINSPIGKNDLTSLLGTPVGLGYTPVILKSTDYTQAIQNNNNIITTPTDLAYVVVGLWSDSGGKG
jgi:hypothetical protein